jgi:hypothetical protein
MFIHTKDKTMYKIHPIVVGTQVFDKSMMTIGMAMVRNIDIAARTRICVSGYD